MLKGCDSGQLSGDSWYLAEVAALPNANGAAVTVDAKVEVVPSPSRQAFNALPLPGAVQLALL